MAAILPLQHLAELASVFSLLDITQDSSKTIASQQVALLNANYYASVSEKILKRITKYYRDHLTDRLLVALAPPSLKELRIDSCSQVTVGGVITIFRKCRHLQLIDLSRCDHLISESLFEVISTIPHLALSAIIVEECERITDHIVQCILKGIPSLKQLKLGSCRNITDNVFLLNKRQQLGLEMLSVDSIHQLKNTTHENTDDTVASQFQCHLVSVDISGCNLTSTAVRHLATLTGPTLREVDISCSKVNSLALWYLSGFSFPAVIRMLSTTEPNKITLRLEQLEKELEQMRNQLLSLWNSDRSKHDHDTGKHGHDLVKCDLDTDKHGHDLVKCDLVKHDLESGKHVHDIVKHDLVKKDLVKCDLDTVKHGHDLVKRKHVAVKDGHVIVKPSIAMQNKHVCDSETVSSIVENPQFLTDQSALLKDEHELSNDQSESVCDKNDFVINVQEKYENSNDQSSLLKDEQELSNSQSKPVYDTKVKDLNSKYQLVCSNQLMSDCLSPDEIKLNLHVSEDDINQSSHTSHQQILSTDQSQDVLYKEGTEDQLKLPIHVQLLNCNQSQSVLDQGSETSAQKKQTDQLQHLTQKHVSSIDQSQCLTQKQSGYSLDICHQMSANNVFSFTDDLMPEPVDFPPRLVNKTYGDNLNQEKDRVDKSGSICISDDARKLEHSETNTFNKTEKPIKTSYSETSKYDPENNETDDLNSKEPSPNRCADASRSIETILESLVKVDELDKTDNSGKTDIDLQLRSFKKLFTSDITSFSACHINICDSVCDRICVNRFFSLNRNIRRLELRWKSLANEALSCISTNLQELRNLSLVDCDNVSDNLLLIVGLQCQKIEKLDLKGVCFFEDEIPVPFLLNGCLSTLSLSESHVTDSTLNLIQQVTSSRIVDLDFSWCEELTEDGVNLIASFCSALRVLNFRHCPATDTTLDLLAEHCPLLENIELSGVQDITDAAVVNLVSHLPLLQVIDISWNFALTDPSVMALFRCCPLLRVAKLSGLKHLTSDAFTPIISDYPRWRKCQALFKFKNRERELLQEMEEQQYSSDEEYEALYLPHRSTVYAPSLQRLELEYCNYIEDDKLQEIVGICCGSLTIIDYYCEKVVSSLSSLVRGSKHLVLKQGIH